ncbi:glycosyltransferase [Pelagicoccus sp. SDUM812002]|uniref:glycosyltransferase family 4 protein n=1 Tax=Pelagicoccus sp. SDUM812002 TaxID=3041266 RepID=UPI00280C92C2|nr:glycosyltransferase [Pelagicoccus sp. SDUM812002]MDQ8188171.1 glycosyltransferase [Pelagicoccus sp. SDUM812002]
MASRKIILLGDKPSVQHGENFAREALKQCLEGLGKDVAIDWKFRMTNLFADSDDIWLFAGESVKANLMESVLIFWNAILLRKRVRLYFHNRSIRFYGKYLGWIRTLGRVDFVLISPFQKRFVPWGHLLSNYIRVAPEASPAPPVKRLVWMSRIEKGKGFLVALDIYRQLCASDPEWSFCVIGPKGDVDTSQLEGLDYRGPLYEDAKFEALSGGGIFIFPSQYRNETQPLVVAEAMSKGLPVVISDVNEIDHMINCSEPPGKAIPEGAVEAGVSAVREIHARYESYSRAALARFESEYSESAFISRLRKMGY